MSDGENYLALGVKEDDGWGSAPFRGDKAHYFEREEVQLWFAAKCPQVTGIFNSLCGMRWFATDTVPLLNPGNFPHCKMCERSLAKRGP